MFIPWDQFAQNDVLEVQGSDSVAQVRDRLLARGNLYADLVVHLSDGRAVPTVVAQLTKLAKARGRRILQMRLAELAEELCPQPWEIADDSPGYRAAEMLAAQRQLPVIVTRAGGRIGLVRPSQEVLSPKEDGLFYLFDQTVPERDRAIFVWVPANATLAHLARELAPYRARPLVYVVLQVAAGEYAVADRAGLNIAIERLAQSEKLPLEQFWGLPLSRFQDAFQPAQVREVEEVSGGQADYLSRARPLVLTRDGMPEILYPARLLGGWDMIRKSPLGYDLNTVPLERLQGISERAAEAPPETTPRFVNLWFANADRTVLERTRPLVMGQSYCLALQIDRLLAASIVDWDRTPGGPQAIVEPQEKNAYLYVSLFSQDFYIPEPTQELLLPQQGPSVPLYFLIEPLRQSRSAEMAQLEVCLYYRTYLVQTFAVSVEVVAEGEAARSAKPQSARLVHYRTTSFPAMEKLPTRALSLTITRDGPDRYRFTFLVDPDPEDEMAARRAVELACHVALSRDELTHLITKARRQLYNVVRIYRLIQKRDQEACARALQALAEVGRQLYRKLFRTEAAQSLHSWMEKQVPPGSTIQVVDRAGDFVFPWSLIYEGKPWGDEIDVRQFWGWRYKLAIATDTLTSTYGQATEQIEAPHGLKILVGLYARLHGAREQNQYFQQLGERPDAKVNLSFVNSSSTAIQALRQADQHLIYFFCHGYTEKMANDIQLDDDLVRQFTADAAAELEALAGQAEGEQEAALREHLNDLFDVSDSWLRLTRGKLPLTMLEEELEKVTFSEHPLVFLNMCQSAQVLPSLSGGLIPFFINRGARAVIGTECSMNMVFGDRFSQAFWERFLQGRPAAEILWHLRRENLEAGDPLGLAYTLFGDADLRLIPIRATGADH